MKHRLENIQLNFTKTKNGCSQYDGIDVRAYTTVEARYTEVPGFEDDPDVCALPAMEKYSILREKLTKLPRHYDAEAVAEMNPYERKRGLKSLFELSYPLGQFYDLYEMIYKCLYDAYSLRECWKSEETGYIESLQLDTAGRAPCMLFIGLTGSGKTVAMQQVLSTLPMSISHSIEGDQFLQIPIISVTVSIGNLSGVLLSIAARIDEIRDSKTYHTDKMRKARIGQGCTILNDWIKTYHIGMIIIDESQFMDFGRGKTSIENLIAVSEETGCSICMIGNHEVFKKIQKYPRLLSRIGDNVLEAKCSSEVDRKLLKNLLIKLWGYNWTGHDAELTNGLADTIMSESMYNVSVMKNLVIMIQFEAVNSWPEDGITADFVREVARKHFSELQTVLYKDTPEGDRKTMEILNSHAQLIEDSMEEDQAAMKSQAAGSMGKDSINPENLTKFENAWDLLASDGFLKTDMKRAFRLAMADNAGLQFLTSLQIYDAVYRKLSRAAKKKASENQAVLSEDTAVEH